jgi:hypothetical protein
MTEFADNTDTPSQWLADIDGPSQWLTNIIKKVVQEVEEEYRNKKIIAIKLTELELDFDDEDDSIPEEEQDEIIASVIGKVFAFELDDEDDDEEDGEDEGEGDENDDDYDKIIAAINEWIEYQTGWCAVDFSFERVEDEPCELTHTE